MDRPEIVPESAQPAFGGLVWSDGTALWVCRGKSTLTPMQIRGMSDHLETKKALTEFWARYLKDEGVAEAVVDWLMPVDMRPPVVGNLLPDDEPGVVETPEGRFQMPAQRSPDVSPPSVDPPAAPASLRADKCSCWGQDAGPGGYCQKCGHLLTCENCCHKRKAPSTPMEHPPAKEVTAAAPPVQQGIVTPSTASMGVTTALPKQIVASAPVQLEVRSGPAINEPSGLPVCLCGSKIIKDCPAHPASKQIEANEATIPVPTTAIVKRSPTTVRVVRDEWYDDPEEAMETLKGVIGRGATDFQARWLLGFCKSMVLNPLAGEASWSSQFGRPVIDVSGYRAHANRRPEFRGMISDKVYDGETFAYKHKTGELVHENKSLEQDPGKFLFAYAIVYRNDRDMPTFYSCSMKEFMPGWRPWGGDTGSKRKQAARDAGYDAFPADKLLAKAERKAIARAFSLGGLSEEDIKDGDTDAG